ncbi:DEAD/DEAH box helicase [Spirosoma montaniterrae]|uniref:DEAD/DEAH box helicase n=1 Tax=Spirosoma montaniterrae TaxID=1178516 RepID=A0A1P9X489_9BACT|nr:DEAD/DEAH box helicase [Spirosoma montaniterrae]AQG82417.1 DEAD/DEAH box helicase [Spirosoma montaniterrae]
MTFNDLNLTKPLLNALTDMGFATPTIIQQRVFSVVMSGRDVCGIAQTGTGKTIAYLLPCLRQHQFMNERHPQILILVPTRELVVQVVDTIRQLTAYMNVQTVGVYGGANLKPQLAEVQQGADILVATPGRLTDILLTGTVKLKSLKRLVIDEVDEMLNLGFRTQLKTIFDLLPAKRQNLLFSATLTADVESLLDTYFTNPVRVEAAPVGTPLDNIQQSAYHVPNFYTKVNLINLLLRRDPAMTKVLVFVATKALADLLYEEIESGMSGSVGVIHSNKAQNARFNSVNEFKAGTYRVLIATDVIARGIDVSDVSHVINFDLPDLPEAYIHRIGRTGRADRAGIAIAFISDSQQDRQAAIEQLMNYAIPTLPLPDELVISDELIEEEKPTVKMKVIDLTPKRDDVGRNAASSAFHEKALKNQKVNVRRDIAAEKRLKYGRPIKRSGKK